MLRIKDVSSGYEQEPLAAPFGFKGGFLTETWQAAASLQSESGNTGIGLGVQSILWSDAKVFADYGEAAGNDIMYRMTRFALGLAREIPFETPADLLDALLKPTYEYGKKLTNNPDLRLTFALNSLVAVDNAAWMLFSREKGISDFDMMIPEDARPALSCHSSQLANIPAVAYGMDIKDISEIISEGYFFLKIKIGSDPAKDGDVEKMLEWDKNRLLEIHKAAGHIEVPYTKSGHVPYYLDANGRYDSKDTLLRFIDYADKIGALDRIILFEEPFPENYKVDVHDIPVRIAADESAHCDTDVSGLIDRGYGAIALKPIAKTLSMSFRIAALAHKASIPCYCADLSVNPVMVDWNKNLAARLAPLPGMKIGAFESNGFQNYANWSRMKAYHPCSGAGWIDTENGIFRLDNDFYEKSGGIFQIGSHYRALAEKEKI